MLVRKVASFALVLALAISASACPGGVSNPVSPGTNPPIDNPPLTGGTYYGPPSGIALEDWKTAFRMDGTIGRPDGFVHLVLPEGTDEATRELLSGYLGKANQWGLQTRYDLVPGGVGLTIPVSIVPGLKCAGKSVAACTTLVYDSAGRLIGRKVEFASLNAMRDETNFLKEAVIRCSGIERNSSKPGLMAESATGTAPKEWELAVLIAREKLPLLARCGKDAYTPCD